MSYEVFDLGAHEVLAVFATEHEAETYAMMRSVNGPALQVRATKAIDNAALVAAVRQHALQHYNHGGWDYLVECWEDSDIIEEADGCSSVEEVIEVIGRILKIKDDYRRDIQGEAF